METCGGFSLLIGTNGVLGETNGGNVPVVSGIDYMKLSLDRLTIDAQVPEVQEKVDH
jgi:hypothetical protein